MGFGLWALVFAYAITLAACIPALYRRLRPRKPQRPPDITGNGLTATALVPAYNEGETLALTIEALLAQTEPFDEIIVINDCSTDDTREIAERYVSRGVKVITPPQNLGSKAHAQNYAVTEGLVHSELVTPVDADTILGPDYLVWIKAAFLEDPKLVVAAGNVQTLYTKTPTERGRQMEYLHGFHYFRPIENAANAPRRLLRLLLTFLTSKLKECDGFPIRTIVEDMDYTWTMQTQCWNARYVSQAESWAADPETYHFLRVQLKRWMYGFFQNVRIHFKTLHRKPMLALWIGMGVVQILTAPLWWGLPFFLVLVLGFDVTETTEWWLAAEIGFTLPPILYACARRGVNPFRTMLSIPYLYSMKVFNMYYAYRGFPRGGGRCAAWIDAWLQRIRKRQLA